MDNSEINDRPNDNGKRGAASYPYSSLASAIKISDAVKDLGGARVRIQRSVLASHLKEADKSASFQQRLNAAKSFGLIDGRSTFMLTDAAQRYYFPTTESEKSSALLRILGSPEAFRQIIERFDGAQLPTREILANILHRELRVPDSWKERVAAFFVNAAQLSGVLDESGFLRFRASREGILSNSPSAGNVVPMESAKTTVSSSPTVSHPLDRIEDHVESNVWNFVQKGKTVRLVTPSELDEGLWKKLNAYVQLLNPNPAEEKSDK